MYFPPTCPVCHKVLKITVKSPCPNCFNTTVEECECGGIKKLKDDILLLHTTLKEAKNALDPSDQYGFQQNSLIPKINDVLTKTKN